MDSLPKSLNLIDFGHKSNSGQGSVRVSVLEAFDPLLTEQNHSGEWSVSHCHREVDGKCLKHKYYKKKLDNVYYWIVY